MTTTEALFDLTAKIAAKRLAELPLTDYGNAERLVHQHAQDLHFAPGIGWLVWDGRRWARDQDGAAMRRAKATVRTMREEAAKLGEKGDDLWKHAQRSEAHARLGAAIALAESEEAVLVRAEGLDADPYLLTALNGTVDLRTGELHEHDRGHLLTKLAPVEYDSHARDERWERFLGEATAGDIELAEFLQRAAGYTLTGSTEEEVLFLAHGPAATGKSTFLEAFRAAFGDYATTADFETFLQRQGAGGPRSGIAQLAGARLVVSIEVDQGRRLAEALVKTITGGDTVRGSFLYHDSFEFVPAFKLWLAANHAPQVGDVDDAIWRRILRLPFEQPVPPERRDRTLKAHLRQPSAAVLAWAVQGCLAWQKRGLDAPDTVQRATADLRKEMDPLADFLEDRCVLEDGAQVTSADLWDAYQGWARNAGERDPLSRQGLVERLKARSMEQTSPRIKGRRTRAWSGIALQGGTPGTGGTGGS